jgi:hypothetical protein
VVGPYPFRVGVREKLPAAAARAWRSRPGWLLIIYVALVVVTGPDKSAGRLDAHTVYVIPVLVLIAFVAWRVWRGGPIARIWLIWTSGVGYLAAAYRLAPHSQDLWLVVAFAAQLALLLSPAIYQRTRRPGDRDFEVRGPVRPGWPRAWVYPWSVLAGLVLTLLLGAHVNFVAFPSCAPAGTALARAPISCIAHARGNPLPFLITGRAGSLISEVALIKDWTEWALICFSVLYAIQVLASRQRPVRQADPGAGHPAPAAAA